MAGRAPNRGGGAGVSGKRGRRRGASQPSVWTLRSLHVRPSTTTVCSPRPSNTYTWTGRPASVAEARIESRSPAPANFAAEHWVATRTALRVAVAVVAGTDRSL